jgi:hypothetical protein
MAPRLSAFPILLLLCARPVCGDVAFSVREGKVDLRASQATVSEILDLLGDEIHVRVVYVGERPTARLSMEFNQRDQGDAVRSVLGRLGPGYGYAIGLAQDRARIAAIVITRSTSDHPTVADPFEPPPGKGESLEPVAEPWQLEARRYELAMRPPRPVRIVPPDPNPEPTFGYGPDPFEPPAGRGDALEPVRVPPQ